MKKRVYLMRHGQTQFNLRRKVQGWCDSPLTENGIKQAIFTKEFFDNRHIVFESAYCSTSERAVDTLELITDLPYKRLKGLKEWNFGTFEGESEDLNPPLPYKDFFKNYGGEDEIEFQHRIVDCIHSIVNNDSSNSILIVSHGAACAQFARFHEATSEVGVARGLKNCCVLVFEVDENNYKLVEINNHQFDF